MNIIHFFSVDTARVTSKPGPISRAYTPLDNGNGVFRLAIKMYRDGVVSTYAHTLKAGDKVRHNCKSFYIYECGTLCESRLKSAKVPNF